MAGTDGSDKKSLINLMTRLDKLPKNAKDKSKKVLPKTDSVARSPKRKTRNKCSSTTPSPSTKRKKAETENNHPKITSWLNKNIDKKLKPLDVSVNKNQKVVKKPEGISKKKLERTASFEKYGIVLPSFEKILADQKKFEEEKEQIKIFDSFDDVFGKEIKTDCLNEIQKYTGELLDCKHLSLKTLHGAFTKHLNTLKNIMSGKTYSERHQIFHKFDVKYRRTIKDLKCSASLVVFTQDQIDYLLELMREQLDPEDRKTTYFFQVLLPELCLLIFMDTHDMNKRQANKYLDERPLDL